MLFYSYFKTLVGKEVTVTFPMPSPPASLPNQVGLRDIGRAQCAHAERFAHGADLNI